MKLLLISMLVINIPSSCVDELTSSLGPVGAVIKPFGKVAGIIYGSMTPLVNVVKKIPTWVEKAPKPEIKDDEERNLIESLPTKEEKLVEETAEHLNIEIEQNLEERPQEQVQEVALVHVDQEVVEEQEEAQQENISQEGVEVIEVLQVEDQLVATDPDPVTSVEDAVKIECLLAINELINIISVEDFSDFSKMTNPKKPIFQVLKQVETLVKNIQPPIINNIDASITTIEDSLNRISKKKSTENNQQEKVILLEAIQGLKDKMN